MRSIGIIGSVWLAFFLLSTLVARAQQETKDKKITKFDLYHADASEIIFSDIEDTTYAFDNVAFGFGDGVIYCDSAVYIENREARLWGNVIIDDPEYHIAADSIRYDMNSTLMYAMGDYVELWFKKDSIFAVGTWAVFHRETEFFKMTERPTLYFAYPDTARMIEVIADSVQYEPNLDRARCVGEVVIKGQEMFSTSGLAYMYPSTNRLELFEQPVVEREGSYISGANINIMSNAGNIRRIEVIDSAYAEFEEPTDSTERFFDRSRLKGKRMLLDFENGELSLLTCVGQAYCWYQPSSQGGSQQSENESSGDTIRFHIVDNQLSQVDILGGAVGTYIVTEVTVTDTIIDQTVDTIDYRGEEIHYYVTDSLITLDRSAHVTSGSVALEAARIELDTRRNIIEAWSASLDPSTRADTTEEISEYEPNEIPVLLRDGGEEFYGNYLEYSIETEKGRIEQSKSGVEKGTYYGKEAFRSQKQVFYVSHGRYTPCDINYLHFYSRHMKFIEGEKLIAKPVVMYVDKLPILALPYYVFPLQSGRHSGFTQFTLGNIERGDRYIRNVGYYWAASEYWDIRGAMDYYERNSTINFYGQLSYNKRYLYNGYISGNLTRETNYFGSPISEEASKTRWNVKAAHRHEFSPDFKISASGSYQADPSFYKDYSANLEERLNRTLRSQVNFTKRFGRSVSVSGRVSHDVNLDTEIRTTYAPNFGVSLPPIRPFGTGKKDVKGKLVQKWYNNLIISYRPNVTNYSRGVTVITNIDNFYDTTFVVDTLTGLVDTSITFNSADTTKYRSRKKYARVDHSVSVNFPTSIARYIIFTPNFRYSENWYQIYATDQAESDSIEAGRYRTYGYSFGTGLSTKLYGTVMPNVAGLLGLRQVITPTLSYNFTPKIDRHPGIRSYAGGGAGSSVKSSRMGISLNHVYQAKVAFGEREKNFELLSITHTTNYDFENQERPWGGLNTSFRSQVLPNVNLYGGMSHSFYEPGTNNINLTSPYLENFNFNASMSLNGNHFIFDEGASSVPQGVDSASQINPGQSAQSQPGSSSGQWNASIAYSYRESGRGNRFTKSAFLRFNLRFNLTRQTAVTYAQTYDFKRGRTINNQVSITRTLKCWTGNFYWVPVGSNRGYGFRLFVSAIPALKIDNSQNPLNSGYFQALR